MSIVNDGQNGQNVTVSSREAKALAKLGAAPSDLVLPEAGWVLNEQQNAFVEAYVRNGGDHSAAAAESEYPEPAKDGRGLLRLPSIRAAIKREQEIVIAGLVAAADKALSDILRYQDTAPKEKISAARVAYERAGAIKLATIEAERQAGGIGALSGMSVPELERAILEAEQRLEAAGKPAIIDITPTSMRPDSAPIAPGSGAPPVAEGQPSAIPDTTDTV